MGGNYVKNLLIKKRAMVLIFIYIWKSTIHTDDKKYQDHVQ